MLLFLNTQTQTYAEEEVPCRWRIISSSSGCGKKRKLFKLKYWRKLKCWVVFARVENDLWDWPKGSLYSEDKALMSFGLLYSEDTLVVSIFIILVTNLYSTVFLSNCI